MSTPTFIRLSLEQFAQLLAQYPFSRKINAVHMHHTWRPSRRDFKGHETIVGMWRFHTQTNGWSDIAQHITIDPQGFIWLGRNWNQAPASAAGHNGNASFGPFMFEMIGDFDQGRDPFDGPQRDSALRVVALVQEQFDLPLESLRFHNMMSSKSCPGSSLDYPQILAEVQSLREQIASQSQGRGIGEPQEGPFPGEQGYILRDAIDALSRTPRGTDPADAELSHDEQEARSADEPREPFAAPRGPGLTPGQLAALQPHLVNLSVGRFTSEGEVTTSAADVDAIFEEHLLEALAVAKRENRKLRVLLYAHGGLISQSGGLEIAHKHVAWWLSNGIYPIYFIWRTGFFETIGSLLKRAWPGATRDLADFSSDLLIEGAARALGGESIWGGMKFSAERAADPVEGGGWYVAGKLKQFCDAHPESVELHGMGHSAGSIFHCHFLTAAHHLRVPKFATLQFLAPAVRVDTFKQHLLELLHKGEVAEKVTIFTMKKHFEKDDDCAGVYRKSLLYLIFNGLEEKRGTPILGLEESLRDDPVLKQLFCLDGKNSGPGQVIWSQTAADTGRSASQSTSHGGFDDDPVTMNSALLRILGLPDAGRINPYPRAKALSQARAWTDEVDWPEGFEQWRQNASIAAPPRYPASPTAIQVIGASVAAAGGRRMALCIGINDYPEPEHRLAGCVADAQMWAQSLSRRGFSIQMLLDGQATREAIDRSIREMVTDSRAGDVIVIQYSGHGTFVADLNGDEADGNDEALCPVDFATGALYIDDDIAEIFARLPDGVHLTCFMDCCHSGSNTRFAVGGVNQRPPGRDVRKRFVPPTEEINRAHALFRQTHCAASRAMDSGGVQRMRDIKFAACQDDEVAWESDGHGEFTLRATRVLDEGSQVTHEQFTQRVVGDFGAQARQHPKLDCADNAKSAVLLQPLQNVGMPGPGRQTEADNAVLMQILQQLQQLNNQPGRR
ncbi:caspase family protein [Pseudomonas fluorescens]|uniref:Uncharacterized protein n=1 Tax=Pseudomonas fluorescens TaxID=294 RepID=A0A5E7CKU3_PSEFL|nr:caspase family protein [Pseudomonas fluorescens]VVO00495.1 hypothetical protein PS691_02591 [Pseudomonas fluorescens]